MGSLGPCRPPGPKQGVLTHSIKSGQQPNAHAAFRSSGHQLQTQSPGAVLLREAQAQPGPQVPTPGLQLCPHVGQDACTASALVFIAREAVEEDDEFHVTVTLEVGSPAE